jgi:hypothetical protein
LLISPSLTTSTPTMLWRATISRTESLTQAASARASTGLPSSFAYMSSTRRSGRGRLPV